MECQFCNIELIGRKRKYCSHNCCAAAWAKKWREENPEAAREKLRLDNKRRIESGKHNEKMKEYYHNNKHKSRERNYARYHKEEFSKSKGNKCEICSCTNNLEIHHKKYNRDCENWQLLCKSCHTKLHNNFL